MEAKAVISRLRERSDDARLPRHGPVGLMPGQVIAAVAFLALAIGASLSIGAADVAPMQVLVALLSKLPLLGVHSRLDPIDSAVIFEVRLPRIVLGCVVGAMLAGAGASYQGVFQNPLADPYLLGVAAGAGLGATLAIVEFPSLIGQSLSPVPLFAFVGALIAVAATYLLGRAGGRPRGATTLVLAGVAVGAFFTALQTYEQQRSSEDLQQVYAWILGGLSTATWQQVELCAPYVAVAGVVLLASRRLLDVMSVGDEEADSLGVPADRVRLVIVGAATLGTAAVVAVSGLIGFVGIIVPHTVRLLFGTSYRRIIPLSMIIGAAFLVLADLLARTIAAPAEVPIGVVTAFLGAPFFLVVLRQARRS